MTTSGTYNFSPSFGDLVIDAFDQCGIRRTALLQEHMASARMSAGLLLSAWSGRGVNLWAIDLQTITLTQGTASYSLPANTITVLDVYAVEGSGAAQNNRIILPIGRSEWASLPNPNQQGQITAFWFDRTLSPTLNFYYTPDGTVSQVQYYRMRQIQDAIYAGADTVEMPVYFLEAFGLGLAHRLAIRWAPERAADLKALADEAYNIAADQNTETAGFYVSPGIGSYYST